MNSTSIEHRSWNWILQHFRLQRGFAFGFLIIAALFAFELFNYSTTDFALNDLLGGLKFMGVRWATILAVAFCGIDFAGIARLFTPDNEANESGTVWYLFGAWLLAATMNAMLTWWGVSIAVLNHEMLGNTVVERETLLRVVPIFVAVLVWLIRVLIIGSFSAASDRLFSQPVERVYAAPGVPTVARRPATAREAAPVHALNSRRPVAARPASARPVSAASASSGNVFRPAPKPAQTAESGYSPSEPTYHPVSMSGPAASAGAARFSSTQVGGVVRR